MKFWSVKFPNGNEVTSHGDDAQAAMSKAFMSATQPIYCCIHEGIRENSNAPVGAMGYYFPPSSYPVSAHPMNYVYMGGGYCLVPA